MRNIVKVLLALCVALYPLIVYFGFKHLLIEQFYFLIMSILVIRVFITRRENSPMARMINLSTIGMVLICIIGYVLKENDLIRLYPILINLSLIFLFVMSLRAGNTPVIETIARLHEKVFPPQAIIYTRNVTKLWLIFFILNGSISTYTYLYSDLEFWTLYNSLISYILTAIVFACEYAVRLCFKRKWAGLNAA